jgi:hypothetical protein
MEVPKGFSRVRPPINLNLSEELDAKINKLVDEYPWQTKGQIIEELLRSQLGMKRMGQE